MQSSDLTPALRASLEFIVAAHEAVIARKTAPHQLGDPLGALARELHSVACKVALVSRLRGEQRTSFDLAIGALEAELIETGVWKTARGHAPRTEEH